jgi:hypothetical protein
MLSDIKIKFEVIVIISFLLQKVEKVSHLRLLCFLMLYKNKIIIYLLKMTMIQFKYLTFKN